MNPIWETTTKVRAFEVDANDRIKVNTILDYFQDAASNDAERLDFGYTNFVPMGLTWVLSWAKFEFFHFPKFADRPEDGLRSLKVASVLLRSRES